MTAEECDNAFDVLEHAMNEAGLTWVTNQVAEDIRFGKARKKSFSVRQEKADLLVAGWYGEEPKRSRETFSTTEPYTSEERLRMLVRALEQTTVAIDRMENSVRDRITRIPENAKFQSVQLVRSDEPDRAPVMIEANPQAARSQHVAELEKLLKALRERI